MAVKREKVHFETVEQLLGAPIEKDATTEVRIDQIFPFENHPFKVLDDDKMDDLVQSIKDNGVLTPVLLRPDDEGTYEMISGHRRMHAAKLAGLVTIPAIIKPMTNDEATIAMVDAKEYYLASAENAWDYIDVDNDSEIWNKFKDVLLEVINEAEKLFTKDLLVKKLNEFKENNYSLELLSKLCAQEKYSYLGRVLSDYWADDFFDKNVFASLYKCQSKHEMAIEYIEGLARRGVDV